MQKTRNKGMPSSSTGRTISNYSLCSFLFLICPASVQGIIACAFAFLYIRYLEKSTRKDIYGQDQKSLPRFFAILLTSLLLLCSFLWRWKSFGIIKRISNAISISPKIILLAVGCFALVGTVRFLSSLPSLLTSLWFKVESSKPDQNHSVSSTMTGISLAEKAMILVCSIGAITICSRSSPIYPLNNWVDANCFFTVGKSMLNGLVPYRDLFEQKGPLLYFLYGIGWLVSHDTFLGVYILEIIASYVFLLYSYRITIVVLGKKHFVFVPIIAILTYTTMAFEQGGSAEEFCLPILAWVVWFLLRDAENQQISNKGFFCLGLAAGCVFWIKFSLIGPFIGWYIWYLVESFRQRKSKRIIGATCHIALGVILATIPWVIYFGLNHSIIDWLEVYLYDNVFHYSRTHLGQSTFSGLRFLINLLRGIDSFYTFNFITLLICAECIALLLFNRRHKLGQMLRFMLISTFLFVYIGGLTFRYYSLVMDVFIAPCLALVVSFVHEKLGILRRREAVFASVLLCLCVFFTTPNRYFMRVQKTDLAQYQFKEIIEQDSREATILNYGFLDGGFYTTCNTLPNCKAFCLLTVPLQEIQDLQQSYLEEGLCDYVITLNEDGAEPDHAFQKYECIMEYESDISWKKGHFRLYKLRS